MVAPACEFLSANESYGESTAAALEFTHPSHYAFFVVIVDPQKLGRLPVNICLLKSSITIRLPHIQIQAVDRSVCRHPALNRFEALETENATTRCYT